MGRRDSKRRVVEESEKARFDGRGRKRTTEELVNNTDKRRSTGERRTVDHGSYEQGYH